MNHPPWLKLGKDVWRLIFYLLTIDQPRTHSIYDVCSLRATCRFMRDVSLIHFGKRWKFSHGHRSTRVRYYEIPPICPDKTYPKKDRQTTIWHRQPRKFKLHIEKPIPNRTQHLESISWRDHKKKTKERRSKRSHHQKKRRPRGDWRRSGVIDNHIDISRWSRRFWSIADVMRERPWAVIRCLEKDIVEDGVVVGKKLYKRQWIDPVAKVVYYEQDYGSKPKIQYYDYWDCWY